MKIRFIKLNNGKRYILPSKFIRDWGAHYSLNMWIAIKKIPKSSVEYELVIETNQILKAFCLIILGFVILSIIF